MDIGGEAIRLIEGADTNEAQRITCPGIVTPQGDIAIRAANDLLSGEPLNKTTRSASIIALSAKDAPVSR
jgi:hypothetical protein